MNHQFRYLINFQQHYSRYLMAALPVTMQTFGLMMFSGIESMVGELDDTLMFVRR